MTGQQIYRAALEQGWEDYFVLLETGNQDEIDRQGKINRLLSSKAITPFTTHVQEGTTQIRQHNHSSGAS